MCGEGCNDVQKKGKNQCGFCLMVGTMYVLECARMTLQPRHEGTSVHTQYLLCRCWWYSAWYTTLFGVLGASAYQRGVDH